MLHLKFGRSVSLYYQTHLRRIPDKERTCDEALKDATVDMKNG